MEKYGKFVAELKDDQLAALVEVMFLAADADGEFTPDERKQFIGSIEMLTDKALPEAKAAELLESAEQALLGSTRAERLGSIKQRLPEEGTRRLALALAIQVTAADGLIRTSERELILEAADALGLDGDTAANMVRDLT